MQQGAEESWSTEVLATGPPGSRTVVTCKVSLQTQEGGVEEKMAGSHRTRLAPLCFWSSSQGQAGTLVPSSLSHFCQRLSWMWHPTPHPCTGWRYFCFTFLQQAKRGQQSTADGIWDMNCQTLLSSCTCPLTRSQGQEVDTYPPSPSPKM